MQSADAMRSEAMAKKQFGARLYTIHILPHSVGLSNTFPFREHQKITCTRRLSFLKKFDKPFYHISNTNQGMPLLAFVDTGIP